MRIRLQLSHKAMLLVAIPLIFEFAFVAILWTLFKQAEYERDRQRHSTAVLAGANSLNRLFVEAISSLVSFGVTRSKSASDRFNRVTGEIPVEFKALKGLVSCNPRQLKALAHIEEVEVEALTVLTKAKSGFESDKQGLASLGIAYMRKDLESTYDQLSASLTQFS